MQLSKEQLAVVNAKENNIVVLAGAGSGKTRTLTERIRKLIEVDKVPPSEIVAITFTVSASDEMKERLADVEGIGDAFVGTIHGFAHTVLKESGETFKIYTTDDEMRLVISEIARMKSQGDDIFITRERYLEYMNQVTLFEKRLITENELRSFLLPAEHVDLNEILDGIVDIRKRLNFITYDELIEKTKAYYATLNTSLNHLLVDEYQDVGHAEHGFLKGLNAENQFFVADDWQSIYSFKGGDPSIIQGLSESKEFTTYMLEDNYRNAKKISEFGQRVIRQTKNFVPKGVNLMRADEEGHVEIHTKHMVDSIIRRLVEQGDFEDWFILVRSNKELSFMQTKLEEFDVPYTTFKRDGMSAEELKAIMSQNVVKLLTVHVSKGLESKNVILYGAFPETVPAYRKTNDEERRVMYVGITRAEDTLIVLN